MNVISVRIFNIAMTFLMVISMSVIAFGQNERADRSERPGTSESLRKEKPDDEPQPVKLNTAAKQNNFTVRQTSKFSATARSNRGLGNVGNIATVTTTTSISVSDETMRSALNDYSAHVARYGPSGKQLSFERFAEAYFISREPRVNNRISAETLIQKSSEEGKSYAAILSRDAGLSPAVSKDVVAKARAQIKLYKK